MGANMEEEANGGLGGAGTTKHGWHRGGLHRAWARRSGYRGVGAGTVGHGSGGGGQVRARKGSRGWKEAESRMGEGAGAEIEAIGLCPAQHEYGYWAHVGIVGLSQHGTPSRLARLTFGFFKNLIVFFFAIAVFQNSNKILKKILNVFIQMATNPPPTTFSSHPFLNFSYEFCCAKLDFL